MILKINRLLVDLKGSKTFQNFGTKFWHKIFQNGSQLKSRKREKKASFWKKELIIALFFKLLEKFIIYFGLLAGIFIIAGYFKKVTM